MPWRCLVSFLLATQVDVFENCDQTVCYMLWTTPHCWLHAWLILCHLIIFILLPNGEEVLSSFFVCRV